MLPMVIFDWYNQYSIADPIFSATVLHTGLHSAMLSTLLTLIHSHPGWKQIVRHNQCNESISFYGTISCPLCLSSGSSPYRNVNCATWNTESRNTESKNQQNQSHSVVYHIANLGLEMGRMLCGSCRLPFILPWTVQGTTYSVTGLCYLPSCEAVV